MGVLLLGPAKMVAVTFLTPANPVLELHRRMALLGRLFGANMTHHKSRLVGLLSMDCSHGAECPRYEFDWGRMEVWYRKGRLPWS